MRVPKFISGLFSSRSLENPKTPLSAPADWLWNALGARTSASGISVTPESSLESSPVWSAVRLISSTVATMPLPVYRRTNDGKQKAIDHPLYTLLHDRFNPEMSSFVARELMMAHLLLYGNCYFEIERNGRGDAVALWPIHPANVRVDRLAGEKIYLVRINAQEVPLTSDAVLHIQGFSLDGSAGLIPMHLMRNAIGLSKATEEYGSSFFANGAAPSGVLSHPGKLGLEGAKNLRESWNKMYSGLSNAHRIAILEEGMEWSPLGIPPEHAQYLETRKFQVAEVARIFQIPPHLIADLERATFSNIEHQSIQYVTHCIEPWCKRIEQEINYKLIGDRGHFAEFQLQGLLRGDATSRANYYTAMSNIGAMTINEIRALENMNAIEGGDVPRVPLNTAELGDDIKEAA